jgi:YidC/Oxa1 family membrane protein insertase
VPLDFIAKPLEHILVAITSATQNYGLSIIIFTILVRLVISPLNLAQLRSAKAMAALSPKLKELQKQHGKDREQLTKATMALYAEHKVNPMAGCLPLIIQLPVLWGLFNALNTLAAPCRGAHGAKAIALCQVNFASFVGGLRNVPLYHSSFLWLPNLGQPDPYHILPIVAGVLQWVQSRMMMQPTTDPQQQQMNQIMQFMPLMIVVFAWNYASGLAVYWVCSTLFSIGLQYFVNRDSPNGPWGQLPILGSGGVPRFLAGLVGARAAAGTGVGAQEAASRNRGTGRPSSTSGSPRVNGMPSGDAASAPQLKDGSSQGKWKTPASRPTIISSPSLREQRSPRSTGGSESLGASDSDDGAERAAPGEVRAGSGTPGRASNRGRSRPQGGRRPGSKTRSG